MLIRFNSARYGSESNSHTAGHIQKRSQDKLLIALDYAAALDGIDYINSCIITAADLEGNNVSSDLLDAYTPGNKVEGTADSGTASQLVDESTNFAAKGAGVGDALVNVSKGFRTAVKEIKTNNADYPFSVLNFSEQSLAVANSDEYKFLFCPTFLQGGSSGTIYEVTFQMTSNLGMVFNDVLLVTVQD